MAQFFKNNFAEDRWRKAALKNAFSLLGKQKFERAAAFFLLGDAVKDAVEVWTGLHGQVVTPLVGVSQFTPRSMSCH